MSIVHARAKKTKSGAIRRPKRDKRLAELGRETILVTIGALEKKPIRTMGGGKKITLKKVDVANVFDPKTRKYAKSKIVTVKENKANRHYVRRNIITKGAVIQTELGLAKVTSRPGQIGMVNAVLIGEK